MNMTAEQINAVKQIYDLITAINTSTVHTPPIEAKKAENAPLPRVRGIKEALAELKQEDPETPITEHMLRRLILSKAIPSIKIGSRYYINMEVLSEYFTRSIDVDEPMAAEYGVIRKIKE